ncbi:MAG: hypothetical protein A2X36_14240 [Elusimicrobia bacterium GWA2_69_24]|nr:MAG: hypothetical protein A2X36_14240 [Elusimicrobia bacterium GWA2_69_24]
MPSAEERRRRKAIVQSLKDRKAAKAGIELEAAGGTSSEWLRAVDLADSLYDARRFVEALPAYQRALALCPGECGTRAIAEHCRRRNDECRRRKPAR